MCRILAISDIHSKYEEFQKLLEGSKYDSTKDTLILLGDYIDRGPDPVKTLELVMSLEKEGAVVLKGNHEVMYLEAMNDIRNGDDCIENFKEDTCGSYSTLLEFCNHGLEQVAIEFFEKLPIKHRIDNRVFVHAGYHPHLSYEMQSQYWLLWGRDQFLRLPGREDLTVVFGHTPTSWNDYYIWRGKGKIGIDCGAVYGGRLACLSFEDGGEDDAEYYVECPL